MTTDDPEPLDATDTGMIRLAAAGLSYTAISEALGVSRSTVARRLRDPKMRREIELETDRRVHGIVRGLTAASHSALDLLRDVVEDTARPDALRVRAADSLLSHLVRVQSVQRVELTAAEARAELLRRLVAMRAAEN